MDKSLHLSSPACIVVVIIVSFEVSVIVGPELAMRFLQAQHRAVAQNQGCSRLCSKPLLSVMHLPGLGVPFTLVVYLFICLLFGGVFLTLVFSFSR